MLAVPAKHVTHPIDHTAFPDLFSTRITRTTTRQIFFFALFTHDLGYYFHPGVILFGSMRVADHSGTRLDSGLISAYDFCL